MFFSNFSFLASYIDKGRDGGLKRVACRTHITLSLESLSLKDKISIRSGVLVEGNFIITLRRRHRCV